MKSFTGFCFILHFITLYFLFFLKMYNKVNRISPKILNKHKTAAQKNIIHISYLWVVFCKNGIAIKNTKVDAYKLLCIYIYMYI